MTVSAALEPESYPTAADLRTPYVLTDVARVAAQCRELVSAIAGVTPFYAMKCNPAAEILQTVADCGASFEVASLGEIHTLEALGIDPASLLYSNPARAGRRSPCAAGGHRRRGWPGRAAG